MKHNAVNSECGGCKLKLYIRWCHFNSGSKHDWTISGNFMRFFGFAFKFLNINSQFRKQNLSLSISTKAKVLGSDVWTHNGVHVPELKLRLVYVFKTQNQTTSTQNLVAWRPFDAKSHTFINFLVRNFSRLNFLLQNLTRCKFFNSNLCVLKKHQSCKYISF